MDIKNLKEGVSVKEIEGFAKKYHIQVVFCLSFILACIFSFVFFGHGWALILATIGAIIGVVMPGKLESFFRGMYHFIFKQEKITRIVLVVVTLLLSVFVPPLIFLILGLHGGKYMVHIAGLIHSEHL